MRATSASICPGSTSQDLRGKPLLERNRALASILPKGQPLIEEALCVADRGLELYQPVLDNDLESIVAKRMDGAYSASTPWLKFKNPTYSQAEGRAELFNKRR